MKGLERWGETLLGAIVVAVAVGFFAFASAQGGSKGPTGQSYDLVARFQNASGINVGSDVRISGVKVGVVRTISLDSATYNARLTLAMNQGVQVLDDSTARIATDGLLGGAYVSVEPAGMDPLRPGGEIRNTQGAVDLITVLSSAVSGMSNAGNHTSTATTQDAHP